jgi:hypothetical protein
MGCVPTKEADMDTGPPAYVADGLTTVLATSTGPEAASRFRFPGVLVKAPLAFVTTSRYW